MSAVRLAARLGRMSGGELAFRLRVAARTEVARVAALCRQPRWRVASLASHLDSADPLVARAAEELRRGGRHRAHALLKSHFLEREERLPLSRHAIAAVRDHVIAAHPGVVERARAEAERIERGRLDLLGYRDLGFAVGIATGPAVIDWHSDPVHGRRAPRAWWSRVRFLDPSVGDHKIIWELNRHQHFLRLARAAWLTGECRGRRTFEAHLRGWLAQNPPGVGINWASMLELGLRSMSWLWALHLFTCLPDDPGDSRAATGEAPWIPDLLLGLHAQLQQVSGNLSTYFSPNTHLTGEALALYACGRALPELRAARGWADTGRRVLVEQIEAQVTRDGGHCEQSTHYLRYTLDFYLMALAFARATGDRDAMAALEEACGRLAGGTRALCDVRGRLPMIGDDDGGRLWPMCDRDPADVRDSLAIAAALLNRPDLALGPTPEEALWLLGCRIDSPRAAADAGEPSPMGYIVARPRSADHLVIDGGPHGFLNGGHAHADALSIVYTANGHPLAIDPGTFTYTMSPEWRDRLRSSAWHNTLTLDGRSQSVPCGPFHWERTAAARVQASQAGDGWHFFEGVHDGYLPDVHRRRVAALPGGVLVVVDSVIGSGRHLAEVHWHLHPAWKASAAPGGRIALEHDQGGAVDLVVDGARPTLFNGDDTTGLGWHSPIYGRLARCSTVRLAAEDDLPLVVISVFAERQGEAVRVHRVSPLRAAPGTGDEGRDDSVGVRLHLGARTETLLFAGRRVLLPGGDGSTAAEAGPGRRRHFRLDDEDWFTDARFAWLTSGPGRDVSLRAAVDGAAAVEEPEDRHVWHCRLRRG